MSSRTIFAFAAAALLWSAPAVAWEPAIVGFDGNDIAAPQVTFAAVDGTKLVTPEMAGAGGAGATEATAQDDARPGEMIAQHCTCK